MPNQLRFAALLAAWTRELTEAHTSRTARANSPLRMFQMPRRLRSEHLLKELDYRLGVRCVATIVHVVSKVLRLA